MTKLASKAKEKGLGGGQSHRAKTTSSQSKPKNGSRTGDNTRVVPAQATHTIPVTFFADEKASTLHREDMSLEELRDYVLQNTADTKDALLFLKLASFGDRRSPRNSLRWDKNVTSVNGIELDYDGKVVSWDTAVSKSKELNVRCLLYTSPSYTPEKPKWRLLIPYSKPSTQMKMRAAYVARVNGFFGSIFAPESFRLSQSFYCGKALDNLGGDHKAVVLGDDFIDLREDLARYEEQGKKTKTTAGDGYKTHLKNMGDPNPPRTGFNQPLCSATAAYALQHGAVFDREELKTELRDAINKAPKGPDRAPADIERYLSDKYLDDLIESAVEKFGHGVTVEDFVAYAPEHTYIFKPTREKWIAAGVNANCRPAVITTEEGKQKHIKPSDWIDKHHSVQQMVWAPGEPMEIPDRLMMDGGWLNRPGVTCFNLYLPPDIQPGNADDVGPWLDHVHKIYPTDAEHIINFCAHRVQQPQDKINHALFLGGNQGIGKDTILVPVKYAVGKHNVKEVSAGRIMGNFNPFMKSVILFINEARDLGETNRFSLYEHLKTIAAAPPDVIEVNEKHIKEHYVINCTGVIITSNHKTDGIYIPADDRRHYVAWSDYSKEDFTPAYWNKLYAWYRNGGNENVAAYLQMRDISSFDAKAPPPKTPAFWAIVDANVAPEETELTNVLHDLGNPDAVTLEQLKQQAGKDHRHNDIYSFLADRKNHRSIPHRLEDCGYVPVRNDQKQRWFFNGREQVIYAKKGLTFSDQYRAARGLIKQAGKLG